MMEPIGKAISATTGYMLRQVCAILLALGILVGTVPGILIVALCVAILGVGFAFLTMIAPLVGLSIPSVVKEFKKPKVASDNIVHFNQNDTHRK